MIDIREHGGTFGGKGGKQKFVRVSSGLTPPTPIEQNEIWLKTDKTVGKIFFDEDLPVLNTNDVYVDIAGKETVIKIGLIEKGNKYVDFPISQTPTKPRILETDLLDIYASYSIVKILDGSELKLLDAYYWNGTDWKMFSSSNSVMFIGLFGNSKAEIASFNTLTDTKISQTSNSVNLGTSFAVNEDAREIYYRQNYVDGGSGFAVFDYDLNFLRTIGAGVIDERSYPYFVKEGLIFYANYSDLRLVVYNIQTNQKVREIADSYYSQTSEIWDVDPTTKRVAFLGKPPATSSWQGFIYDYETGQKLQTVPSSNVVLIPNTTDCFVGQGAQNKIRKFTNNGTFVFDINTLGSTGYEFSLSNDYKDIFVQIWNSGIGGCDLKRVDISGGTNVTFTVNLKDYVSNNDYDSMIEDDLGNLLGLVNRTMYKHDALTGSLISQIPNSIWSTTVDYQLQGQFKKG